MKKDIHVWHLEMTEKQPDPDQTSPRPYELKKTATCLPELNRFLYVAVGAQWQWYMRLKWSYAEWEAFLSRSNIETWIAYQEGTPIGYFELEAQMARSTEICYFGLLPEFIGKGLGKTLLEDAIARAWQLGGNRVWLHTCSLDHPQALPNYLSRGFKVFKEEDFVDDIPDEPIQPWQGAMKPMPEIR